MRAQAVNTCTHGLLSSLLVQPLCMVLGCLVMHVHNAGLRRLMHARLMPEYRRAILAMRESDMHFAAHDVCVRNTFRREHGRARADPQS